MKKLMIAAAIVCAAVIGQAAQFYWGIGNSSIMGPGTVADGYVDEDGYLLDGIAYLMVNGDTVATAPSINDDFTFGSPYDLTEDKSGTLVDLPRGTIDYEGKAYQIVLTTTDGKYKTVFDDVSYVEKVAAGAGEPAFNYEAFVTTKDAGEWQSVPEPTSGLLLLLGVAGLALRRRRA